MRKTIAKAVTWRLIGTAEIFVISLWTTGHIGTAGHTAGLVAVTSLVMYVVHELAWETPSPARLLFWQDVSRPRSDLDLEPGLQANSVAEAEPCVLQQ